MTYRNGSNVTVFTVRLQCDRLYCEIDVGTATVFYQITICHIQQHSLQLAEA